MEMPQQEELKFASVVCGVLYVMTYGIAMMQESFAGNLDYQQNVGIRLLSWDDIVVILIRCIVPSAIHSSYGYDEGDGPVMLNGLRCNGDEMSLVDCRHSGIGGHIYCRRFGHARVLCSNGIICNCSWLFSCSFCLPLSNEHSIEGNLMI